MNSFISRGDTIVQHLRTSRSPEDVLAAFEWLAAALPRGLTGAKATEAIKWVDQRLKVLSAHARNGDPRQLAAAYELRLMLNRLRGVTPDTVPGDCWTPPAGGPGHFREEWLTDDVLRLATYGHQEPEALGEVLPILADALQDAGCDNEPLLGHLRSDWPHVGACWALGLVLRHALRLDLPGTTLTRLRRLLRFHPVGPLIEPGAHPFPAHDGSR